MKSDRRCFAFWGIFLAFSITSNSLACFGCSPHRTPSPSPSPSPSSPACTIKIVDGGNQVLYPGAEDFRFVARVSGEGCYASEVSWQATYYDGYGEARTGVPQPVSQGSEDLNSEYAVATLSPYSIWMSPRRSSSQGYYHITASIRDRRDTIKIIGDDVKPGKDPRHALVELKNPNTSRTDAMPFWYFLEQIQKNPWLYPFSDQFKYVSEYGSPEYQWYKDGFLPLNDVLIFDPYGAINSYYKTIVAQPPGSPPPWVAIASNPQDVVPKSLMNSQAATSCPEGSCIQEGGIFLGFQDYDTVWSYSASLLDWWQHAAIKTGDNRFTEAPRMGKKVREERTAIVTGYYHKRQAYLDVYSTSGHWAVQWARKQVGKPYSILVSPQEDKYNEDAEYEGFYCSLLVWGAWYHGAGKNIMETNAIRWFGTILPNHLWNGYKEGKLILRADFKRT